MKPHAIDLFSGCGGLTLGLRQAGFRVRAAVESDDLAVETYRRNHRGVRVWHTDIRAVSVSAMRRELQLKPGQLDLLAGCPPCQGFSRLTTLNGSLRRVDSRNDLVLQFIRFVRGLRPKAVMMENVPRLADDRRVRAVTRALSKLGYSWEIQILDAADYGVPQRRRRMILLATRHFAPRFGDKDLGRSCVRKAFRELDGLSDDPLHESTDDRSPAIRRLIAKIPKDGGSRSDLPPEDQLYCHQLTDGFKDVYGRMAWNDVAPTITGGCCNPSKGRFLHPTKNRTVTLREAAVLQSFPVDYFFSLRRGKFAAAQMIGNALPPRFVRHHARAIRRGLEGRRY